MSLTRFGRPHMEKRVASLCDEMLRLWRIKIWTLPTSKGLGLCSHRASRVHQWFVRSGGENRLKSFLSKLHRRFSFLKLHARLSLSFTVVIYIVLTVNTNKRTQTAYIKSLVETGVKCGGVPPGDRLREGVKWEKSASNMEVGLPPPPEPNHRGCSLCWSGGLSPLSLFNSLRSLPPISPKASWV